LSSDELFVNPIAHPIILLRIPMMGFDCHDRTEYGGAPDDDDDNRDDDEV